MTFVDRHFQAQLHERLNKEFAERADQLAQGYATTLEEYRERVGFLNALREVLAWSEEIVSTLNSKPRAA